MDFEGTKGVIYIMIMSEIPPPLARRAKRGVLLLGSKILLKSFVGLKTDGFYL